MRRSYGEQESTSKMMLEREGGSSWGTWSECRKGDIIISYSRTLQDRGMGWSGIIQLNQDKNYRQRYGRSGYSMKKIEMDC